MKGLNSRRSSVTPYLVDPQFDKGLLVLHTMWFDEQTPEHDTSKVPQVEDVVRLGGCGQEVQHGLLVYLHCSIHNHVPRDKVLGVKVLSLGLIEESTDAYVCGYYTE